MAVGPPALVVSFDLMLEELTAVLVVSGALEATSAEPSMAGSDATLGFAEPATAMAQELSQLMPPAGEVAPVEVTSLPPEVEAAARDGSPQPQAQESVLLTPPREGQPASQVGTKRRRRARPLDASHGSLTRCVSCGSRP
jgi:hypothetical protein